MTDPITPPAEADPAPQEGEPPFDAERAKAKISETNREAKALRDRLKAAEARIAEHEQAGQSEIEKAANRAAELEKQLADSQGQALRLQVANEKGLTAKQAARLVGSTAEELTADADDLLSSFAPAEPAAAPAPNPSGQPAERPTPASPDPTTPVVETDPAKLAAAIPRSGLL